MGIGTIKLDKLSVKNNIGFYKVSTDDYVSRDFYIAIDKGAQKLRFYFTEDFLSHIYVIDCTDEDQILVPIEEVHKRAFYGALSESFKIMDSQEFPDRTSYSA